MSPEDIAVDLIAESPTWVVEAGAEDGVPVGLTWAALIPTDTEGWEQIAIDRANAIAFEELLTEWVGEDEDGEWWDQVGGYLVVKVLDEKGKVTEIGRQAAEVMAALSDYPIIDEMKLGEIEQLGADQDWERIEPELSGGYLNQYRGPQLDLGDGLSEKQIEKVVEAYSQRETETKYDDKGYATVDVDLVGDVVKDLDYVVEDDEEENPRRPGLSPLLSELSNLLGPLDTYRQQQLLDYLDAPSLEQWRSVRQYIIVPDLGRRSTLWQWVMIVDSGYPGSDHGGADGPFPDPFTVARAIKAAADYRTEP